MTPKILRSLVAVTAARAGRVDQRQPQRTVVRFVRSILGVIEQRGAVGSIGTRQVDPLMLRNFVLLRLVVAALDRAHGDVVRCLRVGNAQRKTGLEAAL